MKAAEAQKVAIGADHGGYELKEVLKQYLQQLAYTVEDVGTHSDEPVDYPTFAQAVARRVADGTCGRGIMIDGAGIGSAVVANKVPGVRAANCYDVATATNSREHNDANVLTLGAGMISADAAKQIVSVWLTTACTAERHLRRVQMISDIEGGATRDTAAAPAPAAPASSTSPADLSEEDLQRIVDRIGSLLASQAPTGQQMCEHTLRTFYAQGGPKDAETVRRLIGMGAGRIGHELEGGQVPPDVAAYIDHTLLKPDATADQIKKLCEEARQYNFASVCVNPGWVKTAADLLRGSPVKVCSVVGFPLGANTTETKVLETRRAIREGAGEIDMVINIGAMKGGDDECVCRDIREVVQACQERNVICKVIIEAGLLTDDEKVRACQAARRARAHYVKTSTGFGAGGATAKDVALMSEAVKGTKMGVKAAGGIRSLADAEKMIEAGATRIGASAGVKIVAQAKGMTVSE